MTRRDAGALPLAAALLVLTGCAREPERVIDLPPLAGELQALNPPAEPGSGEPNLTLTPDGAALLSWVEPSGDDGHALKLSRLDGAEWSAPTTIASGDDWFVNWADFPSVGALADGTLFAHWLRRSAPGTYAYDVNLSISRDGGASWSDPLIPHRDGTPSEHGFVAMAQLPEGPMGVVWLDGRKTVDENGEPRSHGEAGVEMTLRFAAIDREGALHDERELDSRVCDCCQTGAAPLPDGMLVVYRDRSDEEVRDIAVTTLRSGVWSPPAGIDPDGWRIAGCPVNGPAVAASETRVAVAWFGAPEDKAHTMVAFSADAGSSWGGGIRFDDGRPLGRVGIALLPGGDALVSWMEQVGGGAEIRVRRVTPDGRLSPSRTIAGTDAARSSGFPRMVVARDGVLVAWRDASDPPRVRTANFSLAP